MTIEIRNSDELVAALAFLASQPESFVIIHGPNSRAAINHPTKLDGNLPRSKAAVEVLDAWTRGRRKSFEGQTLEQAVAAAVEAKESATNTLSFSKSLSKKRGAPPHPTPPESVDIEVGPGVEVDNDEDSDD
jgi:hypothetical protein